MTGLGTIDDAIRSMLREEIREIFREEFRTAVEELRTLSPRAEKEFLSVEEAAELIGVSETTVREWIANGLRHYQQGRVVRLRRPELLAFLSSQDGEKVKAEDMDQKAIAFLRRG